MVLLKNRKEWLPWARSIAESNCEKVRDLSAPTSYPCLAYDVVADWGMEWSRPVYVYPKQLEAYLREMGMIVLKAAIVTALLNDAMLGASYESVALSAAPKVKRAAKKRRENYRAIKGSISQA